MWVNTCLTTSVEEVQTGSSDIQAATMNRKGDLPILLVNVYNRSMPFNSKSIAMTDLNNFLSGFITFHLLIVCGDFNLTFEPSSLDRELTEEEDQELGIP